MIAPGAVAAWLDDVGRSCRSGTTLHESLVATATTDQLDEHVEPLRRRLRHGDSVGDAAGWWRDRLPSEHEAMATAATVILVADEVGGSVSEPLDRTAALLRSLQADIDERSGWSAQARLSALVMAALPIAVLGVLVVVDGAVLDVVTTPTGALLLLGGLALDGVGFAWMQRIVRRADS